jgi:5-methylcytosine-specific restriction endonuclease McrA
MNITWTCEHCGKTEKTSHRVFSVTHQHDKKLHQLVPYKKARKKSNPDSVKKLKSDLWDLFSEYIRRKDADENGYATCVTCGATKHWKEQQAGHFVSRSHGATFVDPHNVHVQCYRCNMTLKGNMIAYHDFMLKTYGQGEIDRLQRIARFTHKWKVYELQNLIKQTQEQLQEAIDK